MHLKVTHYLNDPADSLSMSLNYVSRIKRDHRGNLWVGTITGGGLNCLNTHTGKFQRYLSGANIYGLFEDSQGRIWAGTDDGIYWNKDMKTFSKLNVFDQDEELGIVLSIMEDKKGNLWLQTYDGLVRLNSEGKNPKLYGKNQGYYSMSSTSGPNYFIRHRGDWGELLYGDKTGYYAVFPENLKSNPHAPQIAISQFKLQDTTGKHHLVLTFRDRSGRGDEIQLSHNQNAFSVDLAAIHYTSPEDNRLQYKMENYDKSWRQGTPSETVYYYNLNPGNYQLKVRAANSDGVWVERSVSILINPPWWQTWWAYSIYGLLILLALYGIHRYQKARYVRLERERSRAKELAQANEIKKAYHELRIMQNQLIQQEKMASLGELTAGIAHEIQNPLNFVNNFSEVNTELLGEMKEMLDYAHYDNARSIAEEIIRNEQKIVDHGHRADNIVKNMLQHSRSSSGIMEPVSLNNLTDEYVKLAYHGLRAKDKDFNAIIHKDFDQSISSINLVSQDIGRVLLNLYNNAFYAVAEMKMKDKPGYEPTIWVSTKNLGKNVEISIRDNGSGITEKNKDKIFQPFFTTKPTGQGTGLGLSISYDIVKAHGGEIRAESKEGEGSNFIVQFPA
jgi:signal transduction histidine kinase